MSYVVTASAYLVGGLLVGQWIGTALRQRVRRVRRVRAVRRR